MREPDMIANATPYEWMALIRAEYLEVPGLALTKPQACRLWGLDEELCEIVLDAMVAADFLRKTPHHLYVRADRAR
jgi:hypothetical protein